MNTTVYGTKVVRYSPVVIIAPHAAGDDLKSGVLARILAEHLGASLVVNTVYKKPSNSRAEEWQNRVCDFNALSWDSRRQRHYWPKHCPAMKVFYDDIDEAVHAARSVSADGKAICIHIHSMQSTLLAFDLAAGIKYSGAHRNFIEGRVHPEAGVGVNNGRVTFPYAWLHYVHDALLQTYRAEGLGVTVGKKYQGWSMRSGIQFHKHNNNNDHALQIEIGSRLRDSQERIEQTCAVLCTIISNILDHGYSRTRLRSPQSPERNGVNGDQTA